MNSRDLLRAIAEAEETYVRESEQFSAIAASIKADRKRTRQRSAALLIAAVLCVAVFGGVKLAPRSFRLSAPSGTTESAPPADTSAQSTWEDPTSASATDAAPALPSAENTTEPPGNPGDPGSPGAVFTSMEVSYAEAKEAFAHPIAACETDQFTGYQIGLICPNGDSSASDTVCLSVTYLFTNGSVCLTDQDRLSGSVTPEGEPYPYRGNLFYVQAPDTYDDHLRIGCFPTQESGIAYQAVFDRAADPNEIMDLLLSLKF